MRGNRIVPWYSGSGTGNAVFETSQWQSALAISCTTGEITFKITNRDSKTLTFKLYNGERFDEEVVPFKEVEIIANESASWFYIGYIDLDARV